MPTSLDQDRLKLTVRVNMLNAGFRRYLTARDQLRQLDQACLREGLISALWQYWCQFVRSVLLHSATGAVKSDGSITTSPYLANTEAEIAFASMKLARRHPVGQMRAIAGAHLEPTWGDIDKAILIASGLEVSNSAELLSAFAIPTSLKDLQICRNATAHLGPSTFTDLKSARVRYTETSLRHPTDAALWVDLATHGYLWDTWVDDILLSATYACR